MRLGQQQDHPTMIYMHNRYYSPLLGHFLTPDFRAPDIYDPTTFTEPYAYAAGNPFMYWDPDGLAEVPGGNAQPKPGTADHILHYLRYALYWNSSHSENFYQTRDKAAQALAKAQAATLNKKDRVIASLEQNQFKVMEPGFGKLSAATDFYGDRALLWVLGAGHGGLNYGENTVATGSMAHNALVLGIDQIGVVDPSISGQAAKELAPIVSVFEKKGAIPVIVKGVASPFVEIGTNMILAQEGDFQAEFDLVAGGTEFGLELAPLIFFGPESGGSNIIFRDARRGVTKAAVKSLWEARPPGIRVRRFGNWWVKEVNPSSSAMMKMWGRVSIESQRKGLIKLGDMAVPHQMRNGRLFVQHVGETLPDGSRFLNATAFQSYLQGSLRMRTFWNDIQPRNMGVNGLIFDPSIDPISKIVGIGTFFGVTGTSYWLIYE